MRGDRSLLGQGLLQLTEEGGMVVAFAERRGPVPAGRPAELHVDHGLGLDAVEAESVLQGRPG